MAQTRIQKRNTTKEMTSGRPLVLILQFALPLLVGNLLQQMYNMIDAAIVGRYLGSAALGAVGSTSSVQFLVFGFCIGTCNGFGVPIARDFGAHNQKRMRVEIFHGAVLTAAMAVALGTLCSVFCAQILRLLRVPGDIFGDAYAYLLVIFLGIPFTLMYNLLSCILRAVGDSKTPFLFLLLSTVLNIFLDLFCIIVLGWGCAGAAIATVAAQAVSGILCLLVILHRFEILHPKKEDRHLEAACAREMLTMAVPMGLQFSITAVGSMVLQSANNSLGSLYVSAFTAAMKIKQFAMCPIDAIATGTSVFCSQNLGAGKVDRIRRGLFEGVLIGVLYGVLAGILLFTLGRTLCLLFVSADNLSVLANAQIYLRYDAVLFWTLGILSTARLCVQGLGYSGRAMFSGVMEMIARIAVVTLFVGSIGFTAICIADLAAWTAATCYIVPVAVLTLKRIRSGLAQ